MLIIKIAQLIHNQIKYNLPVYYNLDLFPEQAQRKTRNNKYINNLFMCSKSKLQ